MNQTLVQRGMFLTLWMGVFSQNLPPRWGILGWLMSWIPVVVHFKSLQFDPGFKLCNNVQHVQSSSKCWFFEYRHCIHSNKFCKCRHHVQKACHHSQQRIQETCKWMKLLTLFKIPLAHELVWCYNFGMVVTVCLIQMPASLKNGPMGQTHEQWGLFLTLWMGVFYALNGCFLSKLGFTMSMKYRWKVNLMSTCGILFLN